MAFPFKRCSPTLWSEHMDGLTLEIPLFLFATFAGAFVAGLSGFAFGLVAASLWLYFLSPLQTATLIVTFGLGATIGVPVGVTLLTWADPHKIRVGVGILLIIYIVYAFFRPALKPTTGGAVADASVGFLNRILGGLTGLAAILVTIWSGPRGWPKDVQRTVFQPVAVFIFALSALWLGAKGTVTLETVKLFLIGLPFLFAGTWLGLKLFGKLNEAAFRKLVLALLFASGVALCF
jgi:uncharacterized membrane protein YfcA